MPGSAHAGTKPKPAALRLMGSPNAARGRDADGRLVPDPIAFDRTAPEPPEHLEPEALDLWNRLAPELHRLGLLKRNDYAMLTLLCETWGRYRDASEKVKVEGFTIIGGKGGTIRNPVVGIVIESGREFRQLAQEFGLSPAAEGRLTIPEQPADTDDAYDGE